MDKLEAYLNQVCRSIGGPRAMRQHVRQELREHLLDAVAQHRAAGLTEEQAIERALEEFGQPEEVRSELEATHGHRLMAVAIDKAMQWKEMTMNAKWLWTSWAVLSLGIVIALEVLFLVFAVMFIVPKFQVLLRQGLLDPGILSEQGASWMPAFLEGLSSFTNHYMTFVILLALVGVVLFEWRVRNENKPLMRLAALGTTALGLMVVVAITGGALVISFCLGAPANARLARLFATDQIAQASSAIEALDQSAAKKDWQSLRTHAKTASAIFDNLLKAPAAIPALSVRNDPKSLAAVRSQVVNASEALAQIRELAQKEDSALLQGPVETLKRSYAPLREAVMKPAS